MKYYVREFGGNFELTPNISCYTEAELISEYGYKVIDSNYQDIIADDFIGLEFSDEKYQARKIDESTETLRNRRKSECFEIANRNFFFDEATAEDLSEIKIWYTAWLNVTVSPYAIPEIPKYIKDRI